MSATYTCSARAHTPRSVVQRVTPQNALHIRPRVLTEPPDCTRVNTGGKFFSEYVKKCAVSNSVVVIHIRRLAYCRAVVS